MIVRRQIKVINTTVFAVVVRTEDSRSVVKEIVNPCLTSPCAQQQRCDVIGDTYQCLNVDPCASSPCAQHERCDVIGDTYQCLNVDPCASSPCAQYQRCDVIGRSFRCTDPDPCVSSPCADNERCDVMGSSEYKCTCFTSCGHSTCDDFDVTSNLGNYTHS